jgi:hypothetical protein
MEGDISLPYDIIYNIYFFTNDYSTANCFWILCKSFTYNYMTRYNRSYKHRFEIVFNDLFHFLLMLPDINYHSEFEDLEFYECIMTSGLSKIDKVCIRKDIHFIYYLYKNFFTFYLSNSTNLYIYNVCQQLSCLLLLQGPDFFKDIVTVQFNRNQVSILPKYSDKRIMLRHIMTFYNKYNIRWVTSQVRLIEMYIDNMIFITL